MDINEEFESIVNGTELSSENSTEINEASEVEIDGMERKPRLSIKYWEKLFKGKAETAFDGAHGYIVEIRVSSVLSRHRSETFEYLVKGPDYRWIEFKDKRVSIGF